MCTKKDEVVVEEKPLYWCECGAPKGSHYVEDSPSMKHHWVCNQCGNVTQVG